MASYSPGGARGSWSFSGGAAGRAGAGQTLAQLAGWRAPHSFEVFATSPAVTSPVLPGYSSFDRDGFAESRGASPTAGPDMRASPLSPSPDSPRTAVGMGAASLLKDEPDVARNREKIMFLSLPCKNNGKAPEASSSGGVLSKLLPRKGKDVSYILYVV